MGWEAGVCTLFCAILAARFNPVAKAGNVKHTGVFQHAPRGTPVGFLPPEWHSGLALGAGGVKKHQQAHTKQQQSSRSPHKATEARTM